MGIIPNLYMKYCCTYSAEGILNTNRTLDFTLFKTEIVTVRLLGADAYSQIAKEMAAVSRRAKNKTPSEQSGDRKDEKINLPVACMMGEAMIYTESVLPCKTEDEHTLCGVPPIKMETLLKLQADSALKSVFAALTFSRGSKLSSNYDFINESYFIVNEESVIIQKCHFYDDFPNYKVAELDMDELLAAARLSPYLHNDSDLKEILSLFASSLTPYKTGNLYAFIAAWTALEMFIHKEFAKIKSSMTISINGVEVHEKFAARMTSITNGKFKLLDEFVIIAGYYAGDQVDEDIKEFGAIKMSRDKYFHSMKGDACDLPLEQLKRIMIRYFHLYIDKNIEGFSLQRDTPCS